MEYLPPSNQTTSLENSESAPIENCRGENHASSTEETRISSCYTFNENTREIPRLTLAREQRRNRQLIDKKLGQYEDLRVTDKQIPKETLLEDESENLSQERSTYHNSDPSGSYDNSINTEHARVDAAYIQKSLPDDGCLRKTNEAAEENCLNSEGLHSNLSNSENGMHEEVPFQTNRDIAVTNQLNHGPSEELACERLEKSQNESVVNNTNILRGTTNSTLQDKANTFEFPVAVFKSNSDMMDEEKPERKLECEDKSGLPPTSTGSQANQGASKIQNTLQKKSQNPNNNSKKLNLPNRFSAPLNQAKKGAEGRSLSRKSEHTPTMNVRPNTPAARNNKASTSNAIKVNNTARLSFGDRKPADRDQSSLSGRLGARSDSNKQQSLATNKANSSFTLLKKIELPKNPKVLPKLSKPVQTAKRPRDQIAKSTERDPSQKKENLNAKKPKLSQPLKSHVVSNTTINRPALQENKTKSKVTIPASKENKTKSESAMNLPQKDKQSTDRASGRFGRNEKASKEVSVRKADKTAIQSKGSSTERARSSSASNERKSLKENFAVPKQKNTIAITKKVNTSTTQRTSTSGTPSNRSGNCEICSKDLKASQSRMLACLHKVHTECFTKANKKKPGCPVCNGTIKALQNQALIESKKSIHA